MAVSRITRRSRRFGSHLTVVDEAILALGYVRVSSDEQARKGVSLDVQKARVERFIAQHGWVLHHDVYQDVQTGLRSDRDAYQKMLAEVRALAASGFTVRVVVLRVDRLGRSAEELLRTRRELEEIGAEIHTFQDGGKPDPLMFDLSSVIANNESRTISTRVCDSVDRFWEHGWKLPGKPAWGYAYRDATDEERGQGAPRRVLIPSEAEWDTVEQAFVMFLAGDSYLDIATWAAALPEEARGGRPLAYNDIRRLYAAPVYVGRHGSTAEADEPGLLDRPRGKWTPLLDDARWLAVRAEAARRVRMPAHATERYLLSGLLRCPRCGSRMAGRTKRSMRHHKHGSRVYVQREYTCWGVQRGAVTAGTACAFTAPAAGVEAYVMRVLELLLEIIDRPSTRELLQQAREQEASGDPRARQLVRDLAQAEAAIADLNRKRARATAKLVDGEMTKDDHENYQQHAIAQIAEWQTKLNGLREKQVKRPSAAPLDLVLSQTSGWSRVLKDADMRQVRQILGAFWEQIVPVRVGHGQYEPYMRPTALGKGALGLAVAVAGPEEGLVERVLTSGTADVSTPTNAQPTTGPHPPLRTVV